MNAAERKHVGLIWRPELCVCRHLYKRERQSGVTCTTCFATRWGNPSGGVGMRAINSMTLGALAVFSTCPAQENHLVAADANRRLADTRDSEGERPKLPANALQIARIIGVQAEIEKLSSLAGAKGGDAAPGLSLEQLSLRQQITDAVIAASLDVDSVTAEIDYE